MTEALVGIGVACFGGGVVAATAVFAVRREIVTGLLAAVVVAEKVRRWFWPERGMARGEAWSSETE